MSCLLVVAACSSSDPVEEGAPVVEEGTQQETAAMPDSTETDPTEPEVTSSEATSPEVAAPAAEASPEETGREVTLNWEPLGGPPGGNVFLFAQDDVRPENLYAATRRGLYHSQDQGDTWRLLDESLSRDVTSLGFSEAGAYGCGLSALLSLSPPAEPTAIGEPCYTLAASGSVIVASSSSEMLGTTSLELTLFESGVSAPDWTDISPPEELWADLVEQTNIETPFVAVEQLVVTEGRILALVGVSRGPFDLNHLATRLLASDDLGASWSDVSPRFASPLVMQRLVHQPNNGSIVALAHVNRTDGPFFPLAELAQVSTDGGRSWQSLTAIQDVVSPAIGDVDILDDRVVLTNVDFSIMELDRTSGELIERRAMPNVTGYSFAIVFDQLMYDVSDPDVMYAQGYLGWEGVFRSLDRGQTWERMAGGMVAAPVSNLTTHPEDPGVLIASGNLGYLPHVTRDGGDSWEPLVGTSNMADEVTFSPHDPDEVLMMSERSALLRSNDGGDTWEAVASEFSGQRVYDVAVSQDGDVFFVPNLGTNVSAIRRRGSGDTIPLYEGENVWVNLLGSPDYSYALASVQDGTVLVANSPKKFENHAGIWRFDPGQGAVPEAWSEILRVENANGITDITVAPSDPATIYAGVVGEQGRILASVDGGDTWQPTHGDEFGFVTVHAVAIDPTDSDVIYAAPWGAGLFRSVDRGDSWTEMAVPTVSVAAIVVDANDANHLLLGDRTRPVVWESFDSGETWAMVAAFDEELQYRVFAMLLGPDGLYVSLLGRTETGLASFRPHPSPARPFGSTKTAPI